MKEHRVPPSPCVECGKVMDSADGVKSDNAPNPGDIGLCLYCGHVMIYGVDFQLREPTDSEIIEIAADPDLVRASNMITAYKKRMGEPSRTANKEE